MNDYRVIAMIVVALAIVALIYILRDRITAFRGKFTSKGVEVDLKAKEPLDSPTQGVDLSGARFEDENEFTADRDAKIKAPNMKAGSGNKFHFGKDPKK